MGKRVAFINLHAEGRPENIQIHRLTAIIDGSFLRSHLSPFQTQNLSAAKQFFCNHNLVVGHKNDD